jgi:hypothetical protein
MDEMYTKLRFKFSYRASVPSLALPLNKLKETHQLSHFAGTDGFTTKGTHEMLLVRETVSNNQCIEHIKVASTNFPIERSANNLTQPLANLESIRGTCMAPTRCEIEIRGKAETNGKSSNLIDGFMATRPLTEALKT